MEFGFEIPHWMNPFLENPMLIVIWAAFGMPLFILVFMFVIHWLLGIFSAGFREKVIMVLAVTLVITWLVGFILMMLMFFSGVHPVKLIFCWFLLFITVFVFCIMEYRLVLKWINSHSEINLVKKKR